MYRWINLSLLILFPIAWSAPLLKAGLLPLFSLKEISVLSGLANLWDTDTPLAIVVALFALVAPYAKTFGLALIHFGRAPARLLPLIQIAGKLAMADVFLIALYITVAKGIGVGRLEVGWGLYLFTAAILASLWISLITKQSTRSDGFVSPD